MPIITITVHGVQTSISAWDGAGTASIPGTTPGTIPGTTVTDGDIPITAVGTARGITAAGITRGIMADGTHPGILRGTTAGGTEAVITAVSTMDIIPD